MKALKNILQAIGFSQQVEEDVEYIDDVRNDNPKNSEAAADKRQEQQRQHFKPNAHSNRPHTPPTGSTQSGKKRQGGQPIVSPQEISGLTADIFESVVKIFNESLPDFLRSSVDPEAQRKYLYDSLEASVKEQFAQIGEAARKTTERQWASERDNLRAEVESARSKCKIAEAKQNEFQQQKLSSERQKRALSERVKDLETKVMTLEAEKEQLDLQTKSLVNRIKASEVRDTDVKSLTDQISDLEHQLDESRKATLDARNSAGSNVAELRAQLDENSAALAAKDAALAAKEDEITSLKAAIEATRAELNALKAVEPSDEVKQVREKNRIADAMINDLNAKLSQAKKENEENKRVIERLTSDGKREKAEAEIARERLRIVGDQRQTVDRQSEKISQQATIIDNLTRQVNSLKEKVAEQEKGLEMVDVIQQRMEKFDKIKADYDAKINALKAQRDKLKETIETNLHNQANNENRLRLQISELEEKLKNAESLKPRNNDSKPRPRTDIKISAIDSALDDTDWLDATPDPNASLRNQENDEFGYQEPERQQLPDDPQLSLF